MRRLSFSAVIVLSAFTSSCWFEKKHVVVFIPPPLQTHAQIPADVALLPLPPIIAVDLSALVPPDAPDSFPDLAPPAAPRAPHRAAPAPTHPATPPAAEQTPPPPKLGPLFTPDQRRDYTRALDESLEHVRRALEILSSKNLTPEQAQVKNTISTFQKQAEQYRDQDLVSAVNLAHRADLLAQDLLARIAQ